MTSDTYKALRKLTQPGTIILTCTPKLMAGVSPEGTLFALTTYDPSIFQRLPFAYRGARLSLHKLKPTEVYIPIVGPVKVKRVLVSKGELALRLDQDLLVGERVVGDSEGEIFVSLHGIESIVLETGGISEMCQLATGRDALQACVEYGEETCGLTSTPRMLEENGTINIENLQERVSPWLTGTTGARTDMFTSILQNTVEAGGCLDNIHQVLDALDDASPINPLILHPRKTAQAETNEGIVITGVKWVKGSTYQFWYETHPPQIFDETTQSYWLWERTH
jgi:hypothetical protein